MRAILEKSWSRVNTLALCSKAVAAITASIVVGVMYFARVAPVDGCCLGMSLLPQRRRIGAEWVDHEHAIQVLVWLQVFRQEIGARSRFCRRHDQRIPERKLVAVLDSPAIFEDRVVQQ